MADAKNCPGPWRVHMIEKLRGLPYVPVSAETLIAKVYSKHFGDDEQAEANGRLIAAAPELLEALDILLANLRSDLQCEGHDPNDDARVELAAAAIAKATGCAS